MDNEKVGNLEDLILISKFSYRARSKITSKGKVKAKKRRRGRKKKDSLSISPHKLKPESRIIKRVFIIKC